MQVDFIRFKASDGVELQGWLSEVPGPAVAIHLHGMSGNGYENYFLDNLREMYNGLGISFLAIDSRGRGVISAFWQGGKGNEWGDGSKTAGSCYEIFEESVYDIEGAMAFMRTRGKSSFVLQGHSLGCSKVVNYIVSKGPDGVKAAILLAPTDMVAWASTDPNHKKMLSRAKELVAAGRPEELVSAECWLDKTPLSAQTYPTLSEPGRAVDIYGHGAKPAPISRVQVPMMIEYGSDDIGIKKTVGGIDAWVSSIAKIKNKGTEINIISGASHSFKGYEAKLSGSVRAFIKEL